MQSQKIKTDLYYDDERQIVVNGKAHRNGEAGVRIGLSKFQFILF